MRESAALPLIFITAWEGLVDRANVQAGHRVLVQGGAGGVGHIAVQIAKARGAQIFATGSAKSPEIIEGFGATAIDYRSQAPADYLEQYTDGGGFNIVYDTVGGATLDASFAVLKVYTGHVVSCLGWGERRPCNRCRWTGNGQGRGRHLTDVFEERTFLSYGLR